MSWYKESRRHALAAKGIKTTKPKPIIYNKKLVTHISSNLESLKHGFVNRNRGYGISFARTKDEEMSVPELREPVGTPGRVYAEVTGKGLDYDNLKHKEYIDEMQMKHIKECNEGKRKLVNTSDVLKEQGFDFVNNWNSIGKDNELHVINEDAIKINKLQKLKRDKYGDIIDETGKYYGGGIL